MLAVGSWKIAAVTKDLDTERLGETICLEHLRINKILDRLGLELVEFSNGPDLNWMKHQISLEKQEGTGVELSSEDLEVKFEEENQDREISNEPEDRLHLFLRSKILGGKHPSNLRPSYNRYAVIAPVAIAAILIMAILANQAFADNRISSSNAIGRYYL